jgi:ribosome-binding protein aMBF1 (putative translation factor)
MKRHNGFRRFGPSTFHCEICGRNTRHVENTDAPLCPECWELAGWDNHHNDAGEAPTAEELAFYDGMVAKAVKRGSDGAKMRAAFTFIWES